MEELIAILFLSREISHREHLKTESYAQHMALGSFYIDIIEHADTLAEAYQGRIGKRLSNIPYYSNSFKGNIEKILEQLLKEIEDKRKDVLPNDSPIQNIIDEIVDTYLSTIYKLTFLK